MADAAKIIITEGDAPATPAAGTRVLYAKSTGFFSKDDEGTETGMVGVNGTDGRTWYSGSGAPGDGTGADGDFYLDTTNVAFYGPKAAGTWVGTGPVSMVGLTNPMTTAGDMIYGGVDGAATRLAKGTAGRVLTMNSGATAPEWGKIAMPAGVYELTDGATIAINWNNGATQYVVLGATGRTVTFANPREGEVYRFIIKQDGTGSRTITTWPTVKWAGGAAPTLSTDANAEDVVTLLYADGAYYGDCLAELAAPA